MLFLMTPSNFSDGNPIATMLGLISDLSRVGVKENFNVIQYVHTQWSTPVTEIENYIIMHSTKTFTAVNTFTKSTNQTPKATLKHTTASLTCTACSTVNDICLSMDQPYM